MIFAFLLLIVVILLGMLDQISIFEVLLWGFLAAELITLHGDIEDLLEEIRKDGR